MNGLLWICDFPGTSEHGAMHWRVVQNADGQWCVDESYDQGTTWICNCHVATMEEGLSFVTSWVESVSD